MADPLSLTLAAITLATALKDVIELAQKLNESFKQHALNMEEAKSLAEETLEIVQDIKKFYGRHANTLDDDQDLRESVANLLRDMKLVYEDCLPILDTGSTSRNKLQKIKYTLDTWRRRKEVERRIRILKGQAHKCYRRFTISTQLDTAVGIVQLRGAVVQGFAAMHRQQSAPHVLNDSVLAFMGSAPTILSKLPPHVQLSERLVYRSYITLQVGKIDGLFKILASHGSFPIEEPDSLHLRPFRSFIRLKPLTDLEIENVQSDVFAHIVKIQDSLKRRNNQLSIQRGAHAMSNLSAWLSDLGMVQESLTIIQFAVDIYRTLVKINEDVYGPHLAHALQQMSLSYLETGDVVEAYKMITEAVTLGRQLADVCPTFEAQIQLAELISVSATVGCWNRDWANALKDAEEAVQSYQLLIENPQLMLQTEVMEGPRMTLEETHVNNFAHASLGLHYSLFNTARHDESVRAGLEALKLYRGLEQRHNKSSFSEDIACLCSSLASDKFREIIHPHEALAYATESVHHYEKMLQNSGVVPEKLPEALGLEVELLSSLGRLDEAHAICQKLEHIIQIDIDNQQFRARAFLFLTINLCHLKRYSEAASTGEQLLSMYRSLPLSDDREFNYAYTCTSLAFAEIGNYHKSIQVAEASVKHWRMLAIHNTKYLCHVARSVLSLTRRHFWAGEYQQALKGGGETLNSYSELITGDNSLLEHYLDALELNMEIAQEAQLESESLERSQLVVQYSRALVKQFPSQWLFLIHRIYDHAKLLEDFGHLTDASVAISEALDWFNDHPARDSESAELHANCMDNSIRLELLCLREHSDSRYNVKGTRQGSCNRANLL